MDLKRRIEQDLKAALLAGDKTLTTTLRGLKSVVLNAEIEANKRDVGLSDGEIIEVFQKEAKKRQESADLYRQGGSNEKAEAELAEKTVIERYLPERLSEVELNKLIDGAVSAAGGISPQTMGQIIGRVKAETAGAADGADIARLVKARL